MLHGEDKDHFLTWWGRERGGRERERDREGLGRERERERERGGEDSKRDRERRKSTIEKEWVLR